MNLIDALSRVTRSPDDADGRYFGCLTGVVTDIGTGDNLGRVKARLRGMPDNAESGWLSPQWPGAIEGIPHKNDPILVTFEDGDEHRGFFTCFVTSRTQGRPNEPLVLGTAFASLFNLLVSQFNQLRTDFNTLAGSLAGHTHTGVTTGPGSTGAAVGITPGSTSATACYKCQTHEGVTVANATADQKALSGRAKVGI